MRLRNMTTIYIFNGDKVLLIHKLKSKFSSAPQYCGIVRTLQGA